jgi:hypothetical protein
VNSPELTIGSLLIAPARSGPRPADVLLVFDQDTSEPGAVFTLVLNRPLDQPAQPLAFGLFDTGDDRAWWGGPTPEALALVQVPRRATYDDCHLPSREPRRYLTERTGVWMPGRDHAPSAVTRARVFVGSIWLSADQHELYTREGTVLRATDDLIFDPDPGNLAQRLRGRTPGAAPLRGPEEAGICPQHLSPAVLRSGRILLDLPRKRSRRVRWQP